MFLDTQLLFTEKKTHIPVVWGSLGTCELRCGKMGCFSSLLIWASQLSFIPLNKMCLLYVLRYFHSKVLESGDVKIVFHWQDANANWAYIFVLVKNDK